MIVKNKIIALLLLGLLVSISSALAQTLSPSAIVSQGKFASSTDYTLSWSLGQSNIVQLGDGQYMLTQGIQQPEIDLATNDLLDDYCPGAEIEVGYWSTGFFGPNALFQLQLSDENGGFENALVIGEASADNADLIIGLLPDDINSSNTYRVRVVSLNPDFIGKESNSFTILQPDTYYADVDGDGFGDQNNIRLACEQPAGYASAAGDCNDNNAAIYPGAAEICNTVDDNCNGDINEGIGQTWFVDADGDGFGNPLITLVSCSSVQGYVQNSLDCNDANGAVRPNAIEVCNTIDDDCDNLIDEGVGQTWYADNDQDGYGNAAISVVACTKPAGYVANSTDCADNNALIRPGKAEFCNGLDDDCDGLVDETGSVIPQPTSISGPSIVSPYQTGIVYSVPAIAGATCQWSVPSGVTIVSGQGTFSITVNWGNKKGEVTARYVTSCGKGKKREKDVKFRNRRSMEVDDVVDDEMISEENIVMNVYPNPFKEDLHVTFTLNEASITRVEMIDLTGRTVALLYNGSVEAKETIDVIYNPESLEAGMYICRLIAGSESKQMVVIMVE